METKLNKFIYSVSEKDILSYPTWTKLITPKIQFFYQNVPDYLNKWEIYARMNLSSAGNKFNPFILSTQILPLLYPLVNNLNSIWRGINNIKIPKLHLFYNLLLI